MSIKRICALSLIFCLLLPLGSCAEEHSAATPPIEEAEAEAAIDLLPMLTVCCQGEAPTIDPVHPTGAAKAIVKQLFVAVMRRSAEGYLPYGGDIKCDASGVYTVTCMEGMRYTDGTIITIYDLEYYYKQLGLAAELNAQDEHTLTVTPYALDADGSMYEQLASGLFIPRAYYGEPYNAALPPLGSGPYVLSAQDGNSITMTANEGFMYGAPRSGAVIWRYGEDCTASLLSGAADIAELPAERNVINALDEAGLAYDICPATPGGHILISDKLNEDMRLALTCLMDRESAVHGYYHGLAEAPAYDEAAYAHGYDPGAAEAYLIAAGYALDAEEPWELNAYFAASGTGDDPAYAMLINAANLLSELGGKLIIHDVTPGELASVLESGNADIVCTELFPPGTGWYSLPFYDTLRVIGYSARLDMATVQQAAERCDYTDLLYCVDRRPDE